MSVGTIKVEEIEAKTENLYQGVVILAKRARRINEKQTEELRDQLGEMDNDEDLNDEPDADRESIVSEFDKRPKPTTAAINELMDDKLHYEYKEEEEEKSE